MKFGIYISIALAATICSCSEPNGHKFIGTWRLHDTDDGYVFVIKPSGANYLIQFYEVELDTATNVSQHVQAYLYKLKNDSVMRGDMGEIKYNNVSGLLRWNGGQWKKVSNDVQNLNVR